MQESTVWRGEHLQLQIEVTKWRFAYSVTGLLPETNWNYYVYIAEHQTERFNELWLPPKLVKIRPEFKGFVSYEYHKLFLSDVDWHGGVTFYQKFGELEGFRAIKLGCDFQHLYDAERGYPYTYEEVLLECQATAAQIKELL